MNGTKRGRLLRRAVIAAFAAAAVLPASASADQILYNFDMFTDRINQYGGCGATDGSGEIDYRWIDRPPTSSRISFNICGSLSLYCAEDYGEQTSYESLINFSSSAAGRDCNPGNIAGNVRFQNIIFQGRSLGTINFYNHDGSALY